MNATPSPELLPDLDLHPDLHLDDLAVGTMKMIRVDGHRVCLVRTVDGLHAIDHACPTRATA